MQPRTLSMVLALCLSFPAWQAHAQDGFAPGGRRLDVSDRSARVAANLALGLAGELDAQVNDMRGDVDLEPSVGFDFRGELPVADFLVIGGWFEFLSTETETSGSEREESFSFDGYVRARWVFEVLPGVLYIEPYLLLPLGFTMAILPDDDGSGDDVWPGWNTAALLGAQFLHASGLGGYLELGWRHAEVYMDQSVAGFDLDTSYILNEMALNFGVVYAFGS